MKTIRESIFDDDDIVKDAEDAQLTSVLKKLELDEYISTEDNGLVMMMPDYKYTASDFIDDIVDNWNELSKCTDYIKYMYYYRDARAIGLMNCVDRIEKCKFYKIDFKHPITNRNSIEKVGDVEMAIFSTDKPIKVDSYIKNLLTKHNVYSIYVEYVGPKADTPDYWEELLKIVNYRKIKYVILPYFDEIVSYLDNRPVEITSDIERKIDEYFKLVKLDTLYFTDNVLAYSGRINNLVRIAKVKDKYSVSTISFNPTEDIKSQLK